VVEMRKSRRETRRNSSPERKNHNSNTSRFLHFISFFPFIFWSCLFPKCYKKGFVWSRYWQTAGEREGENPMKTPLPYIIIFGMSTPFVILAIAFANGWIKVPIR